MKKKSCRIFGGFGHESEFSVYVSAARFFEGWIIVAFIYCFYVQMDKKILFFSKGYPQQPRQLRRPRQETVDLMNETLMSVQSEAAAGVSISRDSRAGPKHTISPPDLNENTIRAISGSKHRLDVSPEDVSLPPTTDTEDDQGSYTER